MTFSIAILSNQALLRCFFMGKVQNCWFKLSMECMVNNSKVSILVVSNDLRKCHVGFAVSPEDTCHLCKACLHDDMYLQIQSPEGKIKVNIIIRQKWSEPGQIINHESASKLYPQAVRLYVCHVMNWHHILGGLAKQLARCPRTIRVSGQAIKM